MQTLTIAIGQAGIDFFCRQFLSPRLQDLIRSMPVPDRLIDVGSFHGSGSGMGTDYSNVKVALSAGHLQGFSPVYRSVTQLASGNPTGSEFNLEFAASAFTAQYQWHETGKSKECIQNMSGTVSCQSRNIDRTYDYAPGFSGLQVQVIAAFQFDTTSQTYNVVERRSVATPGEVSANIPSSSVVRNEIQGCSTTEVSASTREAVSQLDFSALINQIMPASLRSIPSSGNLGHDILFEFGLGESGLGFDTTAGRNGFKIGVTGRVRYKGEAYPVPAPAPLGLPPIPEASDPNYLQTYVSSYSINGLQWACFKAGLLHTTATTGNIPNPDALRCATYASAVEALSEYDDTDMYAEIVSAEAPTTAFQSVWEMTDAVLVRVATIPGITAVMPAVSKLRGHSYLEQAELEKALAARQVSPALIAEVVNCARQSGMVMRQKLHFTVFLDTGAATLPKIEFSVSRTDFLTNLRLGLAPASTAQILKFDYQKNSSTTTFLSSTVPDFADEVGSQFGSILWTVVESQYDDCLRRMGAEGVPLPMMQMFHFVFEEAEVSIQQDFVSIKAKVHL
ncbi:MULTISPECIES: hypothetical protein [unclassified Pseudomonas]|uniref:hypothetical protein n=1 Tax=unclassified Pseudomonas TaxID=196821 RepID=UPI0021CA9F94|nr:MULTISPECIES: hypothetical protein [unclassified Pseudomonas]MCU1732577.1 hypothetical protein [Pseudomonas sp. 20P_3.2_Bac4]MCU1746254.1 hypothetical protein [Pseudomonas sp. 20P_3.2_Bac5]